MSDFDVLVVGTGAAGLTAALALADQGKCVGVLAKGKLGGGATEWAQGGIAAVLEEGDSFDNHVRDTMVAGAGLNDREVVEMVVSRAPAAIARLAELGVPFNLGEDGDWHLTREGGHSHRRIVHVHDATGWAVSQALEKAAVAHDNIRLLPDMVAIDLATGRHASEFSTSGAVRGLYAFNRHSQEVEALTARATILAAGGAGRSYLYSTAPRGATGDGIAMAWRAGCRISNMEFMQFHPTCLYNLEVKNFLITEAVRGEGGILRNPQTGERFMKTVDERLELAPRDIVARAIDAEIKRDGLDYVHLDIAHRGPEFVKAHFPTIHEKLLGLGIDITTDPIPVVPAQHYTCGGVVIDRHGRTDAPGLYAAGEVTQSGLHGANRLASNSLLECFVFGEAAADHIVANWDALPECGPIREWDESRVTDSDEEVVIQQVWGEIRRFMWNFVGIVRTTKRLERAKNRIDLLRREVNDYYAHFRVTPDLIELRNLVEVSDLIIRSALARHESRGLHFTLDYPETREEAVDTVLVP
ncbi:L-aspartate oxidase [Sphingomicrobium lutaoense]|uniref:L-aspartate oxidase n=1 Tax=Sphingomicrobium lutaoense TaxID=515949 RepID=A0A839Z560_9SPHN|nr:L-aspartate oxidase [Sphingomicrobium lutaoense]MBB3764752.1 L-aspartate oxidase [Sphingomicrobium lutaoense]